MYVYMSRDAALTFTRTHSTKYAWQIYGQVDIQRGGAYTFCSISDRYKFSKDSLPLNLPYTIMVELTL